ncbi:MAG TPA: insulinase family protein, partial [Spirochaetota bacterium]
RSGNIAIGIASSRPLSEIKVFAEKYLGSIPRGERAHYIVDHESENKRVKDAAGKIFFIPRDIPQSTVLFLSPGVDIHNPTIDSLNVADQILGGGDFNSKLMKEIREKRGLAYSTGSIIRTRDKTGLFMAYAQCDSDKTPQVFSLMQDEVRETAEGKIEEDDLGLAKQSIIRSYIFAFDTELSVISRYLSLWYSGLPEDFLTGYPGRIEKVDRSSIAHAFDGLVKNGYVTIILGREESVKNLKNVERISE